MPRQPKTKRLKEWIKRDAEGIACDCGGYADRADCTAAEIKEQQQSYCGRSYECCIRVFVCRVCKTRLVGMAEAPDCG